MPRRPTAQPHLIVFCFTALVALCELAHARGVAAQAATPAPAGVEPAGEATTPTAAAPPAPVGISEYDALVLRALAEYDAGDWDEARALFKRAHALDPTARTLRTIGMTAFNQADYVGALRHLEMALVDTRRPLTDEQRTHVLGLIDRASRMVGRYRVRMSPSGASLLVDGAVPLLSSEDELLLLPGNRVLRVTALGHRPLERTLSVSGGDRQRLELLLEPEGSAPSAPASAEPTSVSAATTSRAGDDGSTSTTLAVVSLSIGGAALVASGVTLALALADKSELDDGCPERSCPPALEDTRSRYQTLRVVSPVALGVGVAGVAIGALLLLTAGDGGGVEQAWLVPDGLGVRGTL